MKWFKDFKEFLIPKKISRYNTKPTLALGTRTVLLPTLRPRGQC